MGTDANMTPGMATSLLVSAAKRGDMSLLNHLLEQGANPGCWVLSARSNGIRKPLPKVVAEYGQKHACLRLLALACTDEAIASTHMEDWRKRYDLSPVAELVGWGELGEARRLLPVPETAEGARAKIDRLERHRRRLQAVNLPVSMRRYMKRSQVGGISGQD